MAPLRLSKALAARYPWVKTPFIVSAPMRIMSGPALAVSVSRAGGLGFIGPGAKTQDTLTSLQEATSLLQSHPSSSAGSIALPTSPLPIGVGFQLWSDDLETAVQSVQVHQPCAAWLFAPHNIQDLFLWTSRIRAVAPNTQIWVQIGTLTEARQILEHSINNSASSIRPDVIVIQGAEAGGHGRAVDGMGLMTLLPEVADLISSSFSSTSPTSGPAAPALFAAGGIADSRGASAALCLGADGIVMGTRFLAATEARISAGYQREIVRANDAAVSTTRTLIYNHLRGTFGWPGDYSPRGIVNRSYVEHREGRPFEELKKEHDKALKLGDEGWGPEGRLATYAGAGIGLIHGVKDAGAIVEEVRRGVWGRREGEEERETERSVL